MERQPIKHTSIVSLDTIPHVDPPEDQAVINAAITSHTEITFEGRANTHVIDFWPELDALNALLLNRQQPLDSKELLKRSDVDPSYLEAFRRRLGIVAVKLLDVTDTNLVDVNGPTKKLMTYQLSPRLVLTDRRNQPDQHQKDSFTALRIYAESKRTGDAQIDALTGNLIRQEVLTAVIRKYSKEQSAHDLRPLRPPPESVLQSPRIPYQKWPKKEACERYMTQINEGIDAILQGSDIAEEMANRLIEAYHQLLYRHLHIVDSLARKYSSKWAPYDDLFQEGSLTLIEFTLQHASYAHAVTDSPTGPENSFTNEVIVAITKQVSHVDNFEHNSQLPQKIRMRQQSIALATDLFLQEHGRHPTFDQLATMIELTKTQVIEAVVDTRAYTEAEQYKAEPIDQAIQQAAIEQEIHELLQEDILTDRQKIIISLYYGVYVSHLSGAMFSSNTQDLSQFIYPNTARDMPQNLAGQMGQIGELLGVPVKIAYSIMHQGLTTGKKIFAKKGIKSLADW